MSRNRVMTIGATSAVCAAGLMGCGTASTSDGASMKMTGGSAPATSSLAPKLPVPPRSSSAAPSGVACKPAQLGFSYIPGLQGAGNNFGSIAVVNKSGTDCVWRGGVSVSPLTADQQFIADEPPQSATFNGLLLSAHGRAVASGNQPRSDHIAEIIVSGNARDNASASSGTCTAAHQFTPAYWGVATLGAKFTVRNYGKNPSGFTGVTWCRGSHLETVHVDGRP